MQDEIQSYHLSKKYCTLHPLVVCFIGSDRNIQHNTFCFISEDNNHNTNFVYKTKQSLFVFYKEILKKTFQLWIRYSISLTAVLNIIRIAKTLLICHHQQVFNMDAKWIFSTTSHRKSPCDGVRGFVKCYVVKRNLKRPLHDQILR